MGQSRSKLIWTEICAIQSESLRVQMIEMVLQSPDIVYDAKVSGMYGNILLWLTNAKAGRVQRFPYATSKEPQREKEKEKQQQQYQNTEVVVHAVAKAKDYFQESVALLGIDEQEEITPERLKIGFRAAALRTHPDKPGGSKGAFDEVTRAYKYIEKILLRLNPVMKPETMETIVASRESVLTDMKPIKLSSKNLDMSSFNKLFEDNRLPDPARDNGYGDWLNSKDTDVAAPQLKGKFTPQAFESAIRDHVSNNNMSIVKQLEPDAMIPTVGTELGADVSNFTTPFGATTQFMDLKEAYTTGSTRFQEVADVHVSERTVRSVDEARRIRETEMARVDPDESVRFAVASAALEERERQRRLRSVQQDIAADSWADQMRRRLFVSNS